MKRTINLLICLLMVVLILLSGVISISAEESAEQPRIVFGEYPEGESDPAFLSALVQKAQEVLADYYKGYYWDDDNPDTENTLDIRNTRVICVKEDLDEVQEEYISSAQEEVFGDVRYVVEFLEYMDMPGSTISLPGTDSVVVYDDGTMRYIYSIFRTYASRVFSYDFSTIIDQVIDLHEEYNQVIRFQDHQIIYGKSEIYYYSGNVVDGKTIIDFSITLEPDGTFNWYETPFSSFIGMGQYTISDGILTLMNDSELTGNSDVNYFRMEGGNLYFIEEGSSNFPYVKLEDGAKFVLGENPTGDWTEELQPEDLPDDQQDDQTPLATEDDPNTADVKEKFLRWRLTTNQDDRRTQYKAAMDEVMEETEQLEVPSSEAPGIYVTPELEEISEQISGQYYSSISDITSDDFIRKMEQNRTPMRDDELYTEYEASMTFVDAIFGEGKEDPFASGLIYDFDARVIVEGYENIPNYSYEQDDDGYFHMTGQITVDEGLVTNVYFSNLYL